MVRCRDCRHREALPGKGRGLYCETCTDFRAALVARMLAGENKAQLDSDLKARQRIERAAKNKFA